VFQAFGDGGQDDKYEKLTSPMGISDQDLLLGSELPAILPRDIIPWHRQFGILCERAFKDQVRRWRTLLIQLVETVIIAILVGTVFLKIGNDQVSVTKRQSVLFFCCVNQGVFGALILLNTLPRERLLVLRERAAGTYYVSAYFVSKILIEGLAQIPFPWIFSLTVYWLIGFQDHPGNFFGFATLMLLCHFSAVSLAIFISAFARTTDRAVVMLPLVLELCRLFGGFYLSPAALPNYFVWLSAMSYLKYAYTGSSLNELTGLEYNCTKLQLVHTGNETTCPITSGNQTIYTWGFETLTAPQCGGILLSYIFGFFVLSYLGIRFIK